MKISLYPSIPNDIINDSDVFLISRPSGGVWASLRASVGSIMKRIGIGADGKYAKSVLPDDVVYFSNLDAQLSEHQQSLLKLLLTPSWNATVGSTTLWPETEFARRSQSLRANGYYPEANSAKPYYCAGQWLDVNEAIKALLDHYTPYMGGVQCSTRVNRPMTVKTSDSSLMLDYACVNNSNPRAIALGANAWADSVRPTSMKRAFDGCYNLQAIIGEIDMTSITSAWNANSLFRNCPNLWQFHLANIPDAIAELDLSGVSDNCVIPFRSSSALSEGDSISYLAQNFDRDISRSKPLTVTVSGNVYDTILRSPDYYRVGDGITYKVK